MRLWLRLSYDFCDYGCDFPAAAGRLESWGGAWAPWKPGRERSRGRGRRLLCPDPARSHEALEGWQRGATGRGISCTSRARNGARRGAVGAAQQSKMCAALCGVAVVAWQGGKPAGCVFYITGIKTGYKGAESPTVAVQKESPATRQGKRESPPVHPGAAR